MPRRPRLRACVAARAATLSATFPVGAQEAPPAFGERLGVEVVNVDVVVSDEIAGTVSTLTATVERPEE